MKEADKIFVALGAYGVGLLIMVVYYLAEATSQLKKIARRMKRKKG